MNQAELHPLVFEQQRPLLEFCRAEGIVLQGYAPLGSADGAAELLSHPTITAIAEKHGEGATPAAVALRWALAHGVSVLPKSSKPERLAANGALTPDPSPASDCG